MWHVCERRKRRRRGRRRRGGGRGGGGGKRRGPAGLWFVGWGRGNEYVRRKCRGICIVMNALYSHECVGAWSRGRGSNHAKGIAIVYCWCCCSCWLLLLLFGSLLDWLDGHGLMAPPPPEPPVALLRLLVVLMEVVGRQRGAWDACTALFGQGKSTATRISDEGEP